MEIRNCSEKLLPELKLFSEIVTGRKMTLKNGIQKLASAVLLEYRPEFVVYFMGPSTFSLASGAFASCCQI